MTLMFFGLLVPCLAQNPSKAQTNGPSTNTPVLEVRFSGTELFNALVRDVTRETDALASERDTTKWRTAGIIASLIVALFGFWGIRSLADLRLKIASDIKDELLSNDTIKHLVDSSVSDQLTDSIEARLSIVAKEFAFYRLSNMATSLDTGTGFTDTERDAALEALAELSTDTTVTNRKEFANSLEKIIDSFASADLDYHIDKLEETFRPIIMKTKGIILSLTQHYGMRVIGDAQTNEEAYARFRRYSDVCQTENMYELALPYIMVVESKMKFIGWENRLNALLQDAEHLTEAEHSSMVDLFQRVADPQKVSKRPTGQVVRLGDSFKQFIVQYGDRLGISQIPPESEEIGEGIESDKDE